MWTDRTSAHSRDGDRRRPRENRSVRHPTPRPWCPGTKRCRAGYGLSRGNRSKSVPIGDFKIRMTSPSVQNRKNRPASADGRKASPIPPLPPARGTAEHATPSGSRWQQDGRPDTLRSCRGNPFCQPVPDVHRKAYHGSGTKSNHQHGRAGNPNLAEPTERRNRPGDGRGEKHQKNDPDIIFFQESHPFSQGEVDKREQSGLWTGRAKNGRRRAPDGAEHQKVSRYFFSFM